MVLEEQATNELLERWEPKIHKMACRWVPYLDKEDLRQELRLVVLRCAEKFEEGRVGEKTGRTAKFHTYLHQAMVWRLARLRAHMLRHNPNPNRVINMGAEWFDPIATGENDLSAKIIRAIRREFQPSAEFELESMGFEPDEVAVLIGKGAGFKVVEVCELTGLSVDRVREIRKATKEVRYDGS